MKRWRCSFCGYIHEGKEPPHRFENVGDEPAAFLSVKGPKPVDLLRLKKDE